MMTIYVIMKYFFCPKMSQHIKLACLSIEWYQHMEKTNSIAPLQKTPTITEPLHKVTLVYVTGSEKRGHLRAICTIEIQTK